MELSLVPYRPPEGVNIIAGKSHFIKTVEDLAEALKESGAEFGLAFCEASGKRLIRKTGTREDLIKEAVGLASRVAAGHFFVIVLGKGHFPLKVMEKVRRVPEVVTLYCATGNPVEFVVVESEQGRAVLGVIDGYPPVGVEDEEATKERKEFLRKIGYKE